MNARGREIMMVLITGFLVIPGIFAIVLLDRSHGSFGVDFGPSQVDASIMNVQGRMSVEGFPEDIFIFGSGLSATLSVKITNKDPDNDIDSVRINIPGSQVQSSSFEWYIPGTEHEWEMTSDQSGIAVFRAKDDLPGHIFGGSAQYDVAGNVDDALDHDPLNNTNEEATFTLTIKTPTSPGFKSGEEAMAVDVADLQTESPGSSWQTVDPFPLPYLVVDNGNRFIVMVLKTASCDMAAIMDGADHFFPTRTSMITSSPIGIKHIGDDGRTLILVSAPGAGKTVKPVIWARSSDLQGDFELDMFQMEIVDKVKGEVSLTTIVGNYTEKIPVEANINVDTDLDDDGVLNNLDSDMDGDGIGNGIDPDPRDPLVNNVAPKNITASTDKEIVKEGESFILKGEAEDANEDPLVFTWTHDKDPSWIRTEKETVVNDLDPGIYTFKLIVSDGKLSGTDTVTIRIEEKENDSFLPWLIGIGIAFALLAVIIVVIIVIKGSDEEKMDLPLINPEPLPVPELETTDRKSGGDNKGVIALTDAASENKDSIMNGGIETVISETSQEPCPECGEPLGTGEMKCLSCGANFDQVLYCPNCDEMIDEKGTVCKNCGIKFDLEYKPR